MNSRLKTIRDNLQNPRIGGSIAGVVIVLALAFSYLEGGEAETNAPDMSVIWYYDLNTGDRYEVDWGEANSNHVPPQPAPSGPLKENSGPLKAGDPAGVRLFVFACDSCQGEKFDGYLETYTADVGRQITSGNMPAAETVKAAEAIKRIDDSDWVRSSGESAGDITSAIAQRCKSKGMRLVQCEVND